jgi:hypothetical protein
MAAFGANDSCPNCGARMAADQHYCLNCGHRRGEPRLPFMDAVVFMETMNAPGGGTGSPPPPPPAQQGGGSRMNANAALIAGVATLVLAIGVGFLIGRSGHEGSNQAATPQIIKVEGGGGGGGEVEEASSTGEESIETGGGNSSKEPNSGGKSKPKGEATKNTSEIAPESKEAEEAGQKASEEVTHSKVPQAKATAKVGESCEQGTSGCSSGGEFNGNFFGE